MSVDTDTGMSVIEPFETPFDRFAEWYAAAQKAEPEYPDAFCLATADARGRPSARIVLLKGWDQDGFVFYTNYESRKGSQLAENAYGAMCFHWKALKRSVRIEGRLQQVAEEVSDAYFASRPRGSQIGAWASSQSRPMKGRFDLERRVAEFAAKYGLGTVPRPAFWGGYVLIPEQIEFWKEGTFRLHERHLFRRCEGGWTMARLYP